MSTISFSSSPCLLYVFLFLLSSSGSKPKTEERFLLLFELSLSRSSPYIFVHIRRSTSAIEVYLGSALLFSIFARFMYPLLIQLEKMETFSCTKFLHRLFRPLRDEMLASR